MAVNSLERLKVARYRAFHWRDGLRIEQKVGLALGVAVLTGLLAQTRVPLPWTPVPITGQTLGVLLSGVLMGSGWGGLSMLLYVVLGIAGVPWFIGWQGGLAHLAGPTGGYLLGFILAAFFIGHFTDRYLNSRRFISLLGLMLIANFIIIYLPGLLQLNLWLNAVQGKSVGITQLLSMGFTPFIVGDLIKVILLASVGWAVTPKES